MEETTEDCFGYLVNWTIDNFSCWNGDIHDPVMTTKTCVISRKVGVQFELYPRGLSGRGDRLRVRLCSLEGTSKVKHLRGDVSFFSSDGSLLCKREINDTEERESVLKLPPGPKFRDVVEHIRKNETLHKDQLTLRFRFRVPSEGEAEGWSQTDYIHSTVEAFETSVKINFVLLKEMGTLEGNFKELYCMEYPLNEGRMERVGLFVKESTTVASFIEMRLGLPSKTVQKKFVVRTVVSLLKSDGSVQRTEENERVIKDEKVWQISGSFTKKEVFQKGHSVVIDIKFIPSSSHKFLSSQMALPRKAFEMIPTKISRPPETNAPSINPDNSANVLKTDLMHLYQNQDSSDFELKCGNVSFPVHKIILSARSPVFKTMFSTDMKEAASGSVDIGDLDPSTLGLFLIYLYTGAVDDLQGESALKLYYAADKYQVPSLKRECADFLCSNICMSNVCEILSVADKHKDDKLMSISHNFILKNFNEVLASEQWESFSKSEPFLALETVTQVAKNKKVRGSDAL